MRTGRPSGPETGVGTSRRCLSRLPQGRSRTLLPLKSFPKSFPSSPSPPPHPVPWSVSYQLPRPFQAQRLPGVSRDDHAFHGAFGMLPDPVDGQVAGRPYGDVTGGASIAVASGTPAPILSPSVPGGGRLLTPCHNLRRAEGQMAPFPWGPQALSWGQGLCCFPWRPSARGSRHSPQLCSADSSRLPSPRLPGVCRRRGRWGHIIRPGCC